MISCRFHQANKISNVPMYTLTLPICSHQTSFLKLTANKVSLLQEMTIPFLKIIMLPSLSQNLNLELEFATWKKWKLQKNIGIRKNRCSNRKFFNYTVSIQISTSCDMTYNNSSMFICQTRKKKHIYNKSGKKTSKHLPGTFVSIFSTEPCLYIHLTSQMFQTNVQKIEKN